jgi:hypothetical protein
MGEGLNVDDVVSWATWAFLQLGGRPGRSEDSPMNSTSSKSVELPVRASQTAKGKSSTTSTSGLQTLCHGSVSAIGIVSLPFGDNNSWLLEMVDKLD